MGFLTMTNMFGDEVSIWDNLESLRGNHEELSKLFVDGKNPTWAFVGNEKWVVTRDVHGTTKAVTFAIYTRESFTNSQYFYLRNKNS